MHDEETTSLYALYHDIGKPFCLVRDSLTGKRHFPNHSEVSHFIWSKFHDNDKVARLIRYDMCIHVMNANQIDLKLLDWSIQDSFTLLVASLAEIHANAFMFGGIQSQSFKMKFTQIDRRGNKICKYWKNKM